MFPGLCLFCSKETRDNKTALIPKGWAHLQCYYSRGFKDPFEASQVIECCQALHSLRSLGGGIWQPDKRILREEIWGLDEQNKGIIRFLISENGNLVKQPNKALKERKFEVYGEQFEREDLQ